MIPIQMYWICLSYLYLNNYRPEWMALRRDIRIIADDREPHAALGIINTSSTKLASWKRSPIYKYPYKLGKEGLIYNLKKQKYIYYKYCIYGIILTTNLRNYLKLKYRVIIKTV